MADMDSDTHTRFAALLFGRRPHEHTEVTSAASQPPQLDTVDLRGLVSVCGHTVAGLPLLLLRVFVHLPQVEGQS